MVFFTPRPLRIEGECLVKIRLRETGSKEFLPGTASGLVMNLSKKGACIVLAQLMLEGRHLFFSTLNNDRYYLVLFFEVGDRSGSQVVVPARSIWMDSWTCEPAWLGYDEKAQSHEKDQFVGKLFSEEQLSKGSKISAFKLGVEFHDSQSELFRRFKKIQAGSGSG